MLIESLWAKWAPEPFAALALVALGWIHLQGRRPGSSPGPRRRRSAAFNAGLAVLAVALLSPLETLAGDLASAHMVQHVLVMLVAAPLLAWSAPSAALLRGLPPNARRAVVRWRRRSLPGALARAADNPVAVWLAHVGVLWLWHAAVLYDAALQRPAVHALEHAAFLVTAVAFWRLVLRARGGRPLLARGTGLLMVFTMALQSVLLSALLTFAHAPWYSAYETTTRGWGLEPLADQQLAGLIMWVPAGLIYLLAALHLLGAWLREPDARPVGSSL